MLLGSTFAGDGPTVGLIVTLNEGFARTTRPLVMLAPLGRRLCPV